VSPGGLGWRWWQHRGMSVGRVTAKSKIFEIKIELREVRPAVLRRVQVPGEISLAGLHEVVQVAMGWTDSHLHEFPGIRGSFDRGSASGCPVAVGGKQGRCQLRSVTGGILKVCDAGSSSPPPSVR
jgi:hypothetical protein